MAFLPRGEQFLGAHKRVAMPDEIAHQLLIRVWPVGVRVMHRNNIDTGRPRSDKIRPHELRQIEKTLNGARMILLRRL